MCCLIPSRLLHYPGTISSELAKLQRLEFVAFGGNKIGGSLPTELGLLTNMLLFSAYKNVLTGTLPTELGKLTAATLLSVRDNIITGQIPTQLGLVTFVADVQSKPAGKQSDWHHTARVVQLGVGL